MENSCRKTFQICFRLISIYYLAFHFCVAYCDEFRPVKAEYVMHFRKIFRDIDNSIAFNRHNAKSLVHCSYRCERTLSSSIYYSINESICHCNNGTDTSTEQDHGKPAIVYGYYEHHLEVSACSLYTVLTLYVSLL